MKRKLPTPVKAKLGMTLVELLTVIAIVGILSSVLVASVGSVRESAHKAEAVSAARSLIAAYLMTTHDNSGRLMMAYGDAGRTLDINGYRASSGSEEAKRYPWRLAKYLDGGMAALYVGEHQHYYREQAQDSPYVASLYPSFGMNSIFVGGTYDGRRYAPDYAPTGRGSRAGATPLPKDFWVLRPGDAYKPSELIVFASALGSSDDYADSLGYYRVSPPAYPGGTGWGSYNAAIPGSMGHISMEYGGNAVTAQLDGSVNTLNEEELNDMRRWSNQAAKRNDPNFSNWESQ